MNGTFLTFEGGEGTGKSTQVRLLSRHLESLGHTVRSLREPGGTAVGEAIRGILLDPSYAGMDAHTELMLYEAARAQLVAEVIEPALQAGEVVICDRFFDSTTAYQGYGRGLSPADIVSLNRLATRGLLPDRTVLLDVGVDVGIERATRETTDRLEGEGAAFHDRVRNGFLAIAASEPDRVRLVDASGTVEEVAEKVLGAIRDLPSLRIEASGS